MSATDRDTLPQTIRSVTDLWEEPLDEVHDVPPLARAILASDWLAARDRAVAAQALRDAADDLAVTCDGNYNPEACETCRAVKEIRNRADTHEAATGSPFIAVDGAMLRVDQIESFAPVAGATGITTLNGREYRSDLPFPEFADKIRSSVWGQNT